jgi:SAM-dependent methyltransferase
MTDLTFTGERFLPGCAGEIAYEHWHRYAFARRFAVGKRVLDAACGEGYGTALIGAVAAAAVGVDIDAAAVAHATARYGAADRMRFVECSCVALPLPDAAFDMVMSFETIEHLAAADQPRMLAEFARVLAPDGILVISSPNKRLYSDARGYRNEFHLHELYRDDLVRALAPVFPAQRWHHQRVGHWSTIWSEDPGVDVEAWLSDAGAVVPYVTAEGMYFVVVAARSAAALPPPTPRISLFTDAEESELRRADDNAREVIRLDALLKERDAAADRQTAHIRHLESLTAERERIIGDIDRRLTELNAVREQRDAQLAETARVIAENKRAMAEDKLAIAAQERVIAYQQSFRGWITQPWRRVRRWRERAR